MEKWESINAGRYRHDSSGGGRKFSGTQADVKKEEKKTEKKKVPQNGGFDDDVVVVADGRRDR